MLSELAERFRVFYTAHCAGAPVQIGAFTSSLFHFFTLDSPSTVHRSPSAIPCGKLFVCPPPDLWPPANLSLRNQVRSGGLPRGTRGRRCCLRWATPDTTSAAPISRWCCPI